MGTSLMTPNDTQPTQVGPITRARANQIQQQVNLILLDSPPNLHENWVLRSAFTLDLRRN